FTSAAAHRPPVRHVANLFHEEPDAGNLHVRICGGSAGKPAGLPDAAVNATRHGERLGGRLPIRLDNA
ncbi:MAG TPA: hypothetical protein VGM90_28160, partial [Kofleriaceae bacterium]